MDKHELAQKILQSPKYRDICADVVLRVVGTALKNHPPRNAEQAARERLHAITGAYFTQKAAKQAEKLAQNLPGEEVLETLLSLHASTKERLPMKDLDHLFSRILACMPPPARTLDLACGILPVYLAARGICGDVTGIDLNHALTRIGQAAGGVTILCRDLASPDSLPKDRFDLALALKLIPVLETEEPGAGKVLLSRVNAKYLVVSFPTRTLSGRNVGMQAHYDSMMERVTPDGYQVLTRIVTERELVFVLEEVPHGKALGGCHSHRESE